MIYYSARVEIIKDILLHIFSNDIDGFQSFFIRLFQFEKLFYVIFIKHTFLITSFSISTLVLHRN